MATAEITAPTKQRPKRVAFIATKKKTKRLLIVALAGAIGWFALAWAGAKFLIVKSEMPSADAIVVLSGSSTYIERAAHAAGLYREGRAPIVVLTNDGLLSGWDAKEQRNFYFCELAARELQQRGVPADRIRIVSGPAAGTFEETMLVRGFAVSHNLKHLLIVTSAYHSRRALWSLRRAASGTGIVTGVDSPPPGWQTPSPSNWWLHRFGWTVVAGEYIKLSYYRLAH